MKTKMFAVFDTKALCYTTPFFMSSVGAALRMFGDAVNDEQTSLCKHPTDFVLHHIGYFDDNSGVVAPLVPVLSLASGGEFVEKNSAALKEVHELVNDKISLNGGN